MGIPCSADDVGYLTPQQLIAISPSAVMLRALGSVVISQHEHETDRV